MDAIYKACSKCKAEKSIEDFPRSSAEPSGHIGYCKPCWNEICRLQRQRCKERNQKPEYQRPQGTKTCSDCNCELPTDSFHRESIRGDGLATICKGCREVRGKAAREKNRKNYRDGATQAVLKQCSACKEELPTRDFHRDRSTSDGLDYTCKQCVREQGFLLREKHKASYEPKTEGTKTCSQCKIEKPVTAFSVHRSVKDGLRYTCRECDSAAYWNLRLEVLMHYCGGNAPSCQCCGQAQLEFLTIEHVNKDGGAHRKEHGRYPIFRWLKKEGYPPGISVLCANCNMSQGHYGYCPCGREKERLRLAQS